MLSFDSLHLICSQEKKPISVLSLCLCGGSPFSATIINSGNIFNTTQEQMSKSNLYNRQAVIRTLKPARKKNRRPFAHQSTNGNYSTPPDAVFSKEDILAARLRVAKVLPYQQSAPPVVGNLSLAIISGLLLALAFPNWNLWSLGWVGAAPLILSAARLQKFWRAFAYGWVAGTIFYLGTSYWVTYSMHNYGEIPLWLSYILATMIAAIFGVFMALFSGVLSFAIKHFGGWAILAAPVVWAASEWLRQQVIGVGWNALGYSQAFQPAIIQMSRLGGVYLVSAFLVLMSAAVVFALIYWGYRRGWVVFSLAVLLGIVVIVIGLQRPADKPSAAMLSVVMVQPNIPVEGDWNNEAFFQQMTLRHLQLAEQGIAEADKKEENEDAANPAIGDAVANAANRPKTRLVILPEAPINFHYERDAKLRKLLADFTRRHKVYLLMCSWGAPREGDAPESNYNSAYLLRPDGELLSRYDKMALMPFGEYVPARGWLPFMDRIPTLVADVKAGNKFTLSDIDNVKLATMICFEVTRPDMARHSRRDGATLFVQLSNETWFGPAAVARQTLSQAVFRAVENDVDLLRVTNSGLSAAITRQGDVLDETPMFQAATRTFQVNTDATVGHLTLYTRAGDWFAVTCTVLSAALLLAAGAFEILRKKEEKRKK